MWTRHKGNLAGTFVNAVVNAGFGNDKLMVEAEEGSSWIYKNKDHGMRNQRFMLKFSNAGCRYDERRYAGPHRSDLLSLMLPHVADDGVSMKVVSLFALALGFVFVSSGNGEVAGLFCRC
jgi:hypothetical protein